MGAGGGEAEGKKGIRGMQPCIFLEHRPLHYRRKHRE